MRCRHRKSPGVRTVEIDMCMFASNKTVPSKSPMRFVTNSSSLERDILKRCDRQHDHQGGGGVGAGTQREFPDALLKAICRSILKEKLQRQMKLRAVVELCPRKMTKMPDVEEFHDIGGTDGYRDTRVG